MQLSMYMHSYIMNHIHSLWLELELLSLSVKWSEACGLCAVDVSQEGAWGGGVGEEWSEDWGVEGAPTLQ
jgi:hypothetical protein